MVVGLGSKEVLRNLYHKYYSDPSNQQDLEFASSDWQEITKDFSVLQSSDGFIKPLELKFWRCQVGSLADRALNYACNASYLAQFKNRKEFLALMNKYSEIIQKLGLSMTYTMFRYICTLALLRRYVNEYVNEQDIKILSIGDGIGVLSVLIKSEFPECRLVMVDLGKTLIYQAYYIGFAYPDSVHELSSGDHQLAGSEVIYCPAEFLESLQGIKFNVAININSMQVP